MRLPPPWTRTPTPEANISLPSSKYDTLPSRSHSSPCSRLVRQVDPFAGLFRSASPTVSDSTGRPLATSIAGTARGARQCFRAPLHGEPPAAETGRPIPASWSRANRRGRDDEQPRRDAPCERHLQRARPVEEHVVRGGARRPRSARPGVLPDAVIRDALEVVRHDSLAIRLRHALELGFGESLAQQRRDRRRILRVCRWRAARSRWCRRPPRR